jgi:hypothetical protein
METETRETNNNYYPEGMGPWGWGRHGAPATGVLGTALGSVGAVVGTAALLWTAMRGQNGNGGCPEDRPVTRYELGLVQQINAKDAIIAKLESQIYTDAKFESVNTATQAAIAAQQRVNDAIMASVNTLGAQAAQFAGMTQMILSPRALAPAEAILKSLPAPTSATSAGTTTSSNG